MHQSLMDRMLQAADKCEMLGIDWAAEQLRLGVEEIRRLAAGIGSTLPKEPPPGLLMSMALRTDHALGCPGYYDMLGDGEHERRLATALVTMRQVYEEVSGFGFYRPDRKEQYEKLEKGECLDGKHYMGRGVTYISPAMLTHCLRCGADIRGRTEADLVPLGEQDIAMLVAIAEELGMSDVLDEALTLEDVVNA